MSELENEPPDERSTARRQANEVIVRRLFEETLGSGALDVIDEVIARDYVGYVHRPAAAWFGPDTFKQYVSRVRNAFFGLEVTIDRLETSGNTVLVHWTATGRHERELLGLEPTCVVGEPGSEPGGRTVTANGTTLWLVSNGEIRQSWTTWSVSSFLDQFEDQTGELRSHVDRRSQLDVADLVDKVVADHADEVVADHADEVVADHADEVVADHADEVVADDVGAATTGSLRQSGGEEGLPSRVRDDERRDTEEPLDG